MSIQRPEGLWQQYEGKAAAEIHRGCGWLLQPHPCDLEPPWDEFNRAVITPWDCEFNNWEGPWNGNLLARFGVGDQLVQRADQSWQLPLASWGADPDGLDELIPIVVEQFTEDESTIGKAEQLLRALPAIRYPISFEVLGLGPQPIYEGITDGREMLQARGENEVPTGWTPPSVTTKFVAHRSDLAVLERQLISHYPNSAVVPGEALDAFADFLPGFDLLNEHGFGSTLGLSTGHVWPLRTFTYLTDDPLAVVLAAMDHLEPYDWAMLQVIFQPVRYPWASNAEQAISNPYKSGQGLFEDISDKLLHQKFSSPLMAVGIRIMTLKQDVYRHLLGWAEQFAEPPQGLHAFDDENQGDLSWSVMARCTFRPGILLNTEELASLVHLPGPKAHSERLSRVKMRTRPAAAATADATSVVLGENIHRGKRRLATIPADLRPRHCYVAGASGTGKSTLLLNMILQDIKAGHGVGLLDPHGDLVKLVLRHIPASRARDVILFDPADEEYPFALNILEAKDQGEQEKIANETVMALYKYFPASWGPRLERILDYTIRTVLHAVPAATLADIERMLTDPVYRAEVIARTTEPRWLEFWNNQFPFMPKNAVEPVLNKLSVFLTQSSVRNIICQRRSTVDFDELINDGKILLANLSTGLLTERISGTLGSFLVTKIVNAAFRRARLPEDQRRPWYLYVDEFQAFMNVSVGFDRILAEARKYHLVLAGLANQYVGQLSNDVRQAIFGNVGTFIVFRLGADDAGTVAKELRPFTQDEIMSLERGQAFARSGGSGTSFNLETYPPPEPPEFDPSQAIVARTRKRYANRTRAAVEAELRRVSTSMQPPSPNATRPRKPPRPGNQTQDEPTDPKEDDFVT